MVAPATNPTTQLALECRSEPIVFDGVRSDLCAALEQIILGRMQHDRNRRTGSLNVGGWKSGEDFFHWSDAPVQELRNAIGDLIGARSPVESLLGRAASAMDGAIDRGEDHIRLGPLGSYRDFVDVRDVASAVRAVVLADRPGEAVFNVGSGHAVTCREAVEQLAKVAGFTGRIEESQPAPGRSAAVDWIAADVGRLHRAVGWQPTHHLGSSLEAVWEGRTP